MENRLKKLISYGNHKLPKTTAIFNLTSATDCPSDKLGLCQAYKAGKCICYALKAEKQYPACLPYRRRQARYWRTAKMSDIVADFFDALYSKRFYVQAGVTEIVTMLRINESGDFRNQSDVDRLDFLASHLKTKRGKKTPGILTYCYTARKDLDFSKLKALIVLGSGFSKKGIKGQFKMISKTDKIPAGYKECPGNCRICNRCPRGLNSVVREH